MHFKISKNYAFELALFLHIRYSNDGVTFFDFTNNWDRYEADHNPKFISHLAILNWTIFELSIYNINHANP